MTSACLPAYALSFGGLGGRENLTERSGQGGGGVPPVHGLLHLLTEPQLAHVAEVSATIGSRGALCVRHGSRAEMGGCLMHAVRQAQAGHGCSRLCVRAEVLESADGSSLGSTTVVDAVTFVCDRIIKGSRLWEAQVRRATHLIRRPSQRQPR